WFDREQRPLQAAALAGAGAPGPWAQPPARAAPPPHPRARPPGREIPAGVAPGRPGAGGTPRRQGPPPPGPAPPRPADPHPGRPHTPRDPRPVGPGGDPMSDHTPGSTGPLPPPLLRHLDQVCDNFEAACQAAGAAGPLPRVEDYLGAAPDTDRAALAVELI